MINEGTCPPTEKRNLDHRRVAEPEESRVIILRFATVLLLSSSTEVPRNRFTSPFFSPLRAGGARMAAEKGLRASEWMNESTAVRVCVCVSGVLEEGVPSETSMVHEISGSTWSMSVYVNGETKVSLPAPG